MKKAAISIKDIARKADVSHSTVSRALRNSPLVNRETAERIRKIAKECRVKCPHQNMHTCLGVHRAQPAHDVVPQRSGRSRNQNPS